MNIKCIIIDDEPLAIKVLENYLQNFQQFELIASFTNPLEAISILKETAIDVIFLDINMSEMNGLDFIKNAKIKSNVVITTAYREYAVESYDLDVLDYLVKPIPFNRFLKAINKITQRVHEKSFIKDKNSIIGSHIFLKVDKKLVKIKFEDILYIASLKDYIKIFTSVGDYMVHKSLTSITEELPKRKFLRIHRSYTIAIDKVISIEGNLIELKSKKIPIGRKYISHAKKIILNAK